MKEEVIYHLSVDQLTETLRCLFFFFCPTLYCVGTNAYSNTSHANAATTHAVLLVSVER